jgi:hypothetical protein
LIKIPTARLPVIPGAFALASAARRSYQWRSSRHCHLIKPGIRSDWEAAMEKEPLIRLDWHGRETVDRLAKLVDEAEQVEIALPPEYHHVLFRTLYPEASVSQYEELDVRGGPELLARIAVVKGLEPFADVAGLLSERYASVRLDSPAIILITMLSAEKQ